MKISVIIPTLDNPDDVYDVIESLNRQLLLPSEIVIVDSSSNDEIDNLIGTINSAIPITYKRFGRAYKYDRLISFFKNLPLINNFFKSTQKRKSLSL